MLEEVFSKFFYTVCVPRGWLHFIFHPDNAQAFLSTAMLNFCKEKGITVDPSVPYQSSSNGLAEAAIKVLFRASACLLATSRLPHRVFPFAWSTAEDVHNSLPKLPSLKSPNFLLDGSETNVGNFRSFGAKCYLLNQKARSTLLEPPGQPGRWLAFCDRHRTKMIVLNEVTQVISPLGTADVSFDESNVESFSEDRDVNEQLSLLDSIDSPFEDTKSGAPLLDVPPAEELESLASAVYSASDTVEQTVKVSYIYTHVLRCVLYIVVIFYMH